MGLLLIGKCYAFTDRTRYVYHQVCLTGMKFESMNTDLVVGIPMNSASRTVY